MFITINQARKVGSWHIFNNLVPIFSIYIQPSYIPFYHCLKSTLITGTVLEVYRAEKSKADLHKSLAQINLVINIGEVRRTISQTRRIAGECGCRLLITDARADYIFLSVRVHQR